MKKNKNITSIDDIINKNFDIDYPDDDNMTNEDSQFVGNLHDVYKKAFLSGQRNGFSTGYTCASATLIRLTGDADGTHECELYACNYHSVKSLKSLGVDESDIEILKPTIKEIERKQKLSNGKRK